MSGNVQGARRKRAGFKDACVISRLGIKKL
jgi:hypothetical protein